MELPVQEVLAHIGELSIENRALNQTLNNAVQRIRHLEELCARAGIDTNTEEPQVSPNGTADGSKAESFS